MDLTERQVVYVGLIGLLLITLGTPLTFVFSMDYQLVELDDTNQDPPVYSYDELDPETKAVIDDVLADEGPWYRRASSGPFDEHLVYVVKGEKAHLIGYVQRYHGGAWYGKLPIITLVSGLVCVGYTIRERMRNHVHTPTVR